RYAARHADRIIAISEQTKRDIVEFLKVDEHKISVIYQGCHPAFKQRYSEAERAAVCSKYSLPIDFILNVGTIETRKNALSVIRAIEQLDVHLVIAGRKTPYLRELVDYLEKKRITKKVTFVHGAPV